jgi:hypothetical protein
MPHAGEHHGEAVLVGGGVLVQSTDAKPIAKSDLRAVT